MKASEKNITDRFIDILMSLSNSDIPEKIFTEVKNSLLDYLGVVLAGSVTLHTQHLSFLRGLSGNLGQALVIGVTSNADIWTAALLNGISAHKEELDDGHRYGMVHLGAPIISALLPVAIEQRVAWKDLWLGIIAGYETAVRLACAIQPYHRNKGFHATGTCGSVGAAIGIAIMLGYSRKQIKATLSAAITSAAGVLEIQEDGSELKPYNAGRAALNGLAAAMTGRIYTFCPDDILGGKRGFLAIFGEEANKESIVQPIFGHYAIQGRYTKLYASCRHSHPSVEAAIKCIHENNIAVDKIKHISIETYKAAIVGHDHKTIQGIGSAKMSIPYSVAVAIITGRAGINEFTRRWIEDMQVNTMISKITIIENSDLTRLAPEKRAAIVHIETLDGQLFNKQVDYPKGEPENPMTQQEINDKFIILCEYAGKKEDIANSIIKTINYEIDTPARLQSLLV